MGQVIALSATYCCCTTMNSLLQKCCGNTNSNGRKRSVLLLYITITAALVNQYVVAPWILEKSNILSHIPYLKGFIYRNWTHGCITGDDESGPTLESCVGNAGVYRPTFLSTIFFFVSAAVSKANPSMNGHAWPEKIILYVISLIVSVALLPNTPLLMPIFTVVMRGLAGVFLVVQQVILIDLAYNWNEHWLLKASDCNRLNGYGSGNKWLKAIIAVSVLFYVITFVGIGLLYQHYNDCTNNSWLITTTLLLILIVTAIQLSGTEGSLMTSSVVSLYAMYLCHAAVSKNPNESCNPSLYANNAWSIFWSLFLTSISLAWTGWSYTAEPRLDNPQTAGSVQANVSTTHRAQQNPDSLNLDVPFLDPDDQPTTGVVVENKTHMDAESVTRKETPNSSIWKLNVIMALISGWVAASLTGWGVYEKSNSAISNPQVSTVNLWMIAISQWVAIILYTWTLLAPRLFPDRDFS